MTNSVYSYFNLAKKFCACKIPEDAGEIEIFFEENREFYLLETYLYEIFNGTIAKNALLLMLKFNVIKVEKDKTYVGNLHALIGRCMNGRKGCVPKEYLSVPDGYMPPEADEPPQWMWKDWPSQNC